MGRLVQLPIGAIFPSIVGVKTTTHVTNAVIGVEAQRIFKDEMCCDSFIPLLCFDAGQLAH